MKRFGTTTATAFALSAAPLAASLAGMIATLEVEDNVTPVLTDNGEVVKAEGVVGGFLELGGKGGHSSLCTATASGRCR